MSMYFEIKLVRFLGGNKFLIKLSKTLDFKYCWLDVVTAEEVDQLMGGN